MSLPCLWFLICNVHDQQHEYFLRTHLVSICLYYLTAWKKTHPRLVTQLPWPFVENIQTLQLICEAWWELRTLKMQNRRDNSWRLFLSASLCFSCLSSCPLFICAPQPWPWHFPSTRALYINFAFLTFHRRPRHTNRARGRGRTNMYDKKKVKSWSYAVLMRQLNGVILFGNLGFHSICLINLEPGIKSLCSLTFENTFLSLYVSSPQLRCYAWIAWIWIFEQNTVF